MTNEAAERLIDYLQEQDGSVDITIQRTLDDALAVAKAEGARLHYLQGALDGLERLSAHFAALGTADQKWLARVLQEEHDFFMRSDPGAKILDAILDEEAAR